MNYAIFRLPSLKFYETVHFQMEVNGCFSNVFIATQLRKTPSLNRNGIEETFSLWNINCNTEKQSSTNAVRLQVDSW